MKFLAIFRKQLMLLHKPKNFLHTKKQPKTSNALGCFFVPNFAEKNLNRAPYKLRIFDPNSGLQNPLCG